MNNVVNRQSLVKLMGERYRDSHDNPQTFGTLDVAAYKEWCALSAYRLGDTHGEVAYFPNAILGNTLCRDLDTLDTFIAPKELITPLPEQPEPEWYYYLDSPEPGCAIRPSFFQEFHPSLVKVSISSLIWAGPFIDLGEALAHATVAMFGIGQAKTISERFAHVTETWEALETDVYEADNTVTLSPYLGDLIEITETWRGNGRTGFYDAGSWSLVSGSSVGPSALQYAKDGFRGWKKTGEYDSVYIYRVEMEKENN